MGAFYFMYGFKAIVFYPVHMNPFMFVYGFSFENFFIFKARSSHDDNENMATRGRKHTYLPIYTPVRKQRFGRYPLW